MFKLVPDAKNFWKWHSTWIGALISAIPIAWMNLPTDIKGFVPAGWEPYIMAGMFVALVLGRVRDQPND